MIKLLPITLFVMGSYLFNNTSEIRNFVDFISYMEFVFPIANILVGLWRLRRNRKIMNSEDSQSIFLAGYFYFIFILSFHFYLGLYINFYFALTTYCCEDSIFNQKQDPTYYIERTLTFWLLILTIAEVRASIRKLLEFLKLSISKSAQKFRAILKRQRMVKEKVKITFLPEKVIFDSIHPLSNLSIA